MPVKARPHFTCLINCSLINKLYKSSISVGLEF